MWNANSRTVQSTNATIYYEVYGDGPAVLFMPGGEENSLHFYANIPHFVRAGYKVLVMNLRGHFQSPCPPLFAHPRFFTDDARAIYAAEGLEKAAIIGESLGGFGALRMAVDHAASVSALILMGSYAGIWSDENFAANSKACSLFLEQLKPSRPAGIDFSSPTAERDLLSRNLVMLGSSDGMTSASLTYLTTMNDQNWWLKPEQFAGYNVPTMLIGGDRDMFLGAGYQRRIVKQIPGAILGEYQDSGHRPYWEDPERFNLCASSFLAGAGWNGEVK